jgi:isochorismate synthase
LKGTLLKKEDIASIDGTGIIISSFNRQNLLMLEGITEIEKSDFILHHSKNKPEATSREDYNKSYHQLIEKINSGDFEKVVLSRVKEIPWKGNTIDLFDKLNTHYTSTFNYLFSCEDYGLWMGASPELLCSIENNKLNTVAIAGTKTKNESWGEKEIQEQLFVTKYIEQELTALGIEEVQLEGPEDLAAGPVEHLKTKISAEIGGTSWASIVNRLHPTPATCGIPTKKSMSFIDEIEIHQRDFYTGYIGILNDKQQFFVNLRCMQIGADSTNLYLGGGITKSSNLDDEWEETERKAKTLESILSSI